jgi:hypothetical protein
MVGRKLRLVAMSAVLVAAGGTASALDLGGIDVSLDSSGGGISVSTGGADSSSGISVGGGGNGVDEGASLDVTNGGGPLVNLERGSNTTNGTVDLGRATGILGGILGGGSPSLGGGVTGGGSAAVYFSALIPRDQQELVNRCTDVFLRPRAYDTDLVSLCRLLSTLPQRGR